MNRFAWSTPRSIPEAAELALDTAAGLMAGAPRSDADTAVLKAGGVDLLDLMKERLLAPDKLVSLAGIAELQAIAQAPDGGLRLGSMVTLERIATDPRVTRHYPALARAAGTSASPQIRNVATLGGNLLQRPRCWYLRAAQYHCLRKGGGHCFAIHGENQYHAVFENRPCAIVHPSTAATALVALGASVRLVDPHGAVRRVPMEAFFVPVEKDVHRENDLRHQEILTAIDLPAQPASARMAHARTNQKSAFDWPLVDVAVVLDLASDGACRSAAIVLGAVAPTPHRAHAAQAEIVGKRMDAGVAEAAGRLAAQGATPLSGNAYKVALVQTLVRRALLEAAG
jgi:xanthine dehydrogenase YagS FAD-binding subunit